MRQYFEISADLKYLDEVNDRTTARQFIRQLLLPLPPTTALTRHQEYLRGLVELPGPALDAQRAARRLQSAKPRPRTSRAATALIAAARDLAFEAYHFQERIKHHIEGVVRIHISNASAEQHKKKLGKVVREYQKANDRLLRHRNFLVHGPRNRHDEFSDLRLAELAAITLHDDLWFEHANVFEEYKEAWCGIANRLLRSIDSSLMIIQNENENAIANGTLNFV